MKFLTHLKLLIVAAVMAAGAGMLAGAVPTLATVAAVSVMAGYSQESQANTTNFAPGVSVVLMPLHIASAGPTVTNAMRFRVPMRMRLVGASAIARTTSGTSPTLTVDVLKDSVSVLSSAITVATSGAPTEATISTSAFTDESVLSINTAVGGSASPTWFDVSVLLTFVRY